MNILLVDDNDELREFLALSLSEANVEASTAATSAMALQKAEATRFDLYVLDSVLGSEDGLELIGQLRATKNGKSTPILLMSSISTALARRMAMGAGATEFLVKPFGQTQFVELVNSLGRGKR